MPLLMAIIDFLWRILDRVWRKSNVLWRKSHRAMAKIIRVEIHECAAVITSVIPRVTFWNRQVRQVRQGPEAQRGREVQRVQRDLAGLLSPLFPARHLFRPAPEAPGDLQNTLSR